MFDLALGRGFPVLKEVYLAIKMAVIERYSVNKPVSVMMTVLIGVLTFTISVRLDDFKALK